MPGKRLFLWPLNRAIPASIIYLALLFSGPVKAQGDDDTGATNLTVSAPAGTSDHGNTGLLCPPPGWTDVLFFLCGNFVAHALTAVSKPGEPRRDLILRTIMALFFPNFGVRDGLNAIFRHAIFVKDPLQRAARAGALCMIERSASWKPRAGDVVGGVSFSEEELRDLSFDTAMKSEAPNRTSPQDSSEKSRQESIASDMTLTPENESTRSDSRRQSDSHRDSETTVVDSENSDTGGQGLPLPELVCASFYPEKCPKNVCPEKIPTKWETNGPVSLSEEYLLRLVPEDAEVKPLVSAEGPSRPDETRYPATLSAHYALVKAVVAIFQTVYSCVTMYQARGDQINRYGYAAFGLTVAPFFVMSIVNLVGNLCTPDYAALQLIGSSILDEARDRGNTADAVIGRLQDCSLSRNTNCWSGTVSSVEDESDTYVTEFTRESGLSDQPLPSISTNQEKETTPATSRSSFTTRVRIDNSPNARCRPSLAETSSLQMVCRRSPLSKRWMRACLISVVTVAPFCINGAISHYEPGQSTLAQRIWTMAWLVSGAVGRLGSTYGPIKEMLYVESDPDDDFWSLSTVALCILIYGMPAIGGMVVVVQMIVEFGTCKMVD